MPPLLNTATGQLEFVADGQVRASLESGSHAISPDFPLQTEALQGSGGITSPEQLQALETGGGPATVVPGAEVAQKEKEAYEAERYGGFAEAGAAAEMGALDFLTAGGAGALMRVGPGGEGQARSIAQHQGAYTGGQIIAGLATLNPEMIAASPVSGATRFIREFGETGAGAGRIAKIAVPTIAGGVEAGALSAAATVGERVWSDDPLNVERGVADLSSSFLYGFGLGAVGTLTGKATEKGLEWARSSGAAAKEAAAAAPVADDIARMDSSQLIDAHKVETAALEQTQAAQKTQAAAEVGAYQTAFEETRPYRVADDTASKVMVDARNTIRHLADDPRGLALKPDAASRALREQEEQLRAIISKAPQMEAGIAAEEADIANQIKKDLATADKATAESAAQAKAADEAKGVRQAAADSKAEVKAAKLEAKALKAEETAARRPDSQSAKAAAKAARMEADSARAAVPKSAVAEAAPAVESPAAAAEPAGPPSIESLEDFSNEVNRAASKLEGHGQYGDRKSFIASVWGEDAAFDEMSLDAFKERLVEANKKGLVRLTRADFSHALEGGEGKIKQSLFKQSLAKQGEADFHLIERGMPFTERAAAEAAAPAAAKVATEAAAPVAAEGAAATEELRIRLKDKAARRWGDLTDRKIKAETTKKGIRISRSDAEDFVRAIESGETAARRAQTLQRVPELLAQNEAIQQRITAASTHPSKLTSPRLDAIVKAQEELKTTGGKRGLGQQLLQGAVYAGVAGAVTPILPDRLKILAPIVAGAASLKVGAGIFRRMGASSAAVAGRTTRAVESFLSVAQRASKVATRAAPILASKVLAQVRYGPPPRKADRDPREAAPMKGDSPLYKVFHAREMEIRDQMTIGTDGKPAMKPEARARIAEVLSPIAAHDPKAADMAETVAARRIEFLYSKLPQKPDLGFQIGPDRHRFSDMQMREWARYAAAVEDPSAIFERAVHGATTPEDAEVAQEVYPEMLAKFKSDLVAGMATLRKTLPQERRISLFILTGVPVDPATDPRVLPVFQNQFADEPGSEGGTQAPPAEPQFNNVKKSIPEPTPAQARAG